MTRRALAVIPARGGSKRLPRKNVQELGGKPLVALTIEAALRSEHFQRIIVSSDDDDILAIGASYDGVEAEQRPSRLSGDNVKVLELMLEFAERAELAAQYGMISLLLPTCPFRTGSDIRAGFELLTEDVDTVVSVAAYDFPHQKSLTIGDDGLASPSDSLLNGNTRSQDLSPTYHPNGGFYISWWQSLLKNRSWYIGRVRAYEMSSLASVDIDDATDLSYAQFLLDSGAIKLND